MSAPLDIARPEGVVFDFDGVIVDTEPLHYRAFMQILEPIGLGFPWKEYVAVYMGFDDRDAFREAFRARGRDLDADGLARLVSAKSRAFLSVVREGVAAYPGAVDLIASLHARGVPLAISSGSLRSDIEPILSSLGVADCFRHVVTADEVERSKPDPECYVLAWRRLAGSFPGRLTIPARSLAVEDTPAGIRAAKGAGLSVLAVTNSFGRDDLAGADVVAASLADVRIA